MKQRRKRKIHIHKTKGQWYATACGRSHYERIGLLYAINFCKKLNNLSKHK